MNNYRTRGPRVAYEYSVTKNEEANMKEILVTFEHRATKWESLLNLAAQISKKS